MAAVPAAGAAAGEGWCLDVMLVPVAVVAQSLGSATVAACALALGEVVELGKPSFRGVPTALPEESVIPRVPAGAERAES